MATIIERTDKTGAKSYQVKVRLKGYPQQTATFTRKTDARKWATQTEAAIRERRHFKTVEATRHTAGDMADRYIKSALLTKAKSTQSTQKKQLEWWKKELGAFTLADCTPALIAEARDKLVQQSSGSTANRYLAVLSHAFTVAQKEWGWIESNPVFSVTKPTEPRGRIRFLSDDERLRLLKACKQSKESYLYPVVVLALSTGMRRGEIMNLTWADVDLKQGRIVLHQTKNKERRVVPLVGYALELLKQHAKVRRLDTPLLWPGGNPEKPKDITLPWYEVLKEAGIEDFKFHDLRHSAASYMLMNGATIAELAEVLGHKTLQMVRRYSHLSEAHSKGLVERMNAVIFDGSS